MLKYFLTLAFLKKLLIRTPSTDHYLLLEKSAYFYHINWRMSSAVANSPEEGRKVVWNVVQDYPAHERVLINLSCSLLEKALSHTLLVLFDGFRLWSDFCGWIFFCNLWWFFQQVRDRCFALIWIVKLTPIVLRVSSICFQTIPQGNITRLQEKA